MLKPANFFTGIVKRFLDALKAESFSYDVFPSFMEALTSLVKCNLTAEVFRSLALFVTYAYHKPNSSATRTPKGQVGGLSSRPNLNMTLTAPAAPRRLTVNAPVDVKEIASLILTKRQLGNKVLEMYSDLLCEKGNTSNIKKFARTVTNKVCALQ
jgi:hypothetical protein